VAQFGEAVLAAPPKKGFNLLAWVLPLVGIVVAGGAIAFLAVRWTRSGRRSGQTAGDPASNGRRALDPELERRLDEELARFDP
jgi:cytochrome c-type biogenesis protein CcmH